MPVSTPFNVLGGGNSLTTATGATIVGTAGITDTQVAYGDTTANTIKGIAAFAFTQATGVLKVGVSGSANSISITGNTNGALTLAAAGTNQSITLTPSGTGNTVLGAGSLTVPGADTNLDLIPVGTGQVRFNKSGTDTRLQLIDSGGLASQLAAVSAVVYLDASQAGGTLQLRTNGSTTGLTINASQDTTLAGNLTVSGTGTSSFIGAVQTYGSANNRAEIKKILYGATTDAATAVELTTNGAAGSGTTNRIVVPANTALSVVVNVAVKQTGSANAKQMLRQFVISNNAGTTAIQGTVVTLGTDSGSAALTTVTCTITANDTDDAIKIDVNGVAATSLRYSAYVISTEVLFA